jgi:hypothetical protein
MEVAPRLSGTAGEQPTTNGQRITHVLTPILQSIITGHGHNKKNIMEPQVMRKS